MSYIEQVIEYPSEFDRESSEGTYRGEILRAGPSMLRHGRGVMIWNFGMSYEGEWREDKKSGKGILTFRSGERYEGEFESLMHGRGAWCDADGQRLYDGTWARHRPRGGAALDGDGVVWRAGYDFTESEGRILIEYLWKKGEEMPAGWTRAGVTVTAGRPPAEAPGSGVWAGAWAWEGGVRVEGRLRGLRPLAGVETDAGGGRWWVTYDGERTLAEGLVVTSRTVRPPAVPLADSFSSLKDSFSSLRGHEIFRSEHHDGRDLSDATDG